MSTISKIDIWNRALSWLGAKSLESPDDDAKSAAKLRIIYPQILREMLEEHPWSFATKTATLAPLDTPDTKYSYAYQLPDGCVKVISLSDERQHWELFEGGQLHTNMKEASAIYIDYVETPAKWSGKFRKALAMALAADLAYSLLQKANLQQMWEDKAKEALDEAKTFDSTQGHEPVSQTSIFEQARHGTPPGENQGIYRPNMAFPSDYTFEEDW